MSGRQNGPNRILLWFDCSYGNNALPVNGGDRIFLPINLCADFQPLDSEYGRCHVIESANPVLSWGAASDTPSSCQSAYLVKLYCGEKQLFDSGWTASEAQRCKVSADLPEGETVTWSLQLKDDHGRTGSEARAEFTLGSVDWTAGWITPPWDDAKRPAYFRKRF